jgi:hypothetical protein
MDIAKILKVYYLPRGIIMGVIFRHRKLNLRIEREVVAGLPYVCLYTI